MKNLRRTSMDKQAKRSIFPFITVLSCLLLGALPLALTRDHYLIIKTVITICFIVLFCYSIKLKKYTHLLFFAYLALMCNPFTDIGIFGDLATHKIFLYPWRVVRLTIILILIYLCYDYYPYRKRSKC